jgi:hypothetical protein
MGSLDLAVAKAAFDTLKNNPAVMKIDLSE